MQNYELLYIIPAKYTEEEVEKINKTIKDLIIEKGGEIIHEDSLGLLRLAYPIKQVYQGYYPIIEFSLEEENFKEVDRGLKLMNEVLRYQIVNKVIGAGKQLKEAIFKEKKEKLEEQRKEQKQQKQSAQGKKKSVKSRRFGLSEKVGERGADKAEPKKKMDIDELEKKLDKILDSDII